MTFLFWLLNLLRTKMVMVFHKSFTFLAETVGCCQTIAISFILFLRGLLKIYFTKRNLLLLLKLGIELVTVVLTVLILASFLSACSANSSSYLIMFILVYLFFSV